MKSSLRELLGRLGPIRVIPRTASGSPATAILSAPEDPKNVDTVASVILLHTQAGLTMIEAKRLIEALLKNSFADVRLPKVLNAETLQADLARAGVVASIRPLTAEQDARNTDRKTALVG